MTNSEELLQKLKALGVQVGASHLTEKPKEKSPAPPAGIESVVPGKTISTVFGETFLVQENYPGDYRHGQIALCADRPMDVLAEWAGTPSITRPGGENVVFLDTETSGLAGGSGTYAFLIGIAYRVPGGFELVQLFMRDPGQESALLAALDRWLDRFNVVVTFNGRTFDLPLLHTRYIMNGITPPLERLEHLDVLQIARKLWRDRLPSRALQELEKDVVRYHRTSQEVPGWLIPQLYFNYLTTGEAAPLAGVFYHNARDLLTLAALYSHIAEMLKDPTGDAVRYGLDLAAIARLYEGMGKIEQAAALYERCLDDGDMPEVFFLKTMGRYAALCRRSGDWQTAAALWQKAAERGEMTACIELSKYYEHRARNDTEALRWAKASLEILDSMRAFPGAFRAAEKEIQRRIGRLQGRVYRVYRARDEER